MFDATNVKKENFHGYIRVQKKAPVYFIWKMREPFFIINKRREKIEGEKGDYLAVPEKENGTRIIIKARELPVVFSSCGISLENMDMPAFFQGPLNPEKTMNRPALSDDGQLHDKNPEDESPEDGQLHDKNPEDESPEV